MNIYTDKYGSKFWFKNEYSRILHRTDGPAIEWENGIKFWYLDGKRINCSSQDEFLRLIKLKILW